MPKPGARVFAGLPGVGRGTPLGWARPARDGQGRRVLGIELTALPVDGRLHIPLDEVLALSGEVEADPDRASEGAPNLH